MVRNIVPPVFNNTGKNFSTGISSALNFNSNTPRMPSGTKAFFSFCPLPACSGLGVTTGGGGWCGGESINNVERSHGFNSPQVSFPVRSVYLNPRPGHSGVRAHDYRGNYRIDPGPIPRGFTL